MVLVCACVLSTPVCSPNHASILSAHALYGVSQCVCVVISAGDLAVYGPVEYAGIARDRAERSEHSTFGQMYGIAIQTQYMYCTFEQMYSIAIQTQYMYCTFEQMYSIAIQTRYMYCTFDMLNQGLPSTAFPPRIRRTRILTLQK